MISKIEAAADAETEEKAWCDEQIAKIAEKKTDLESNIAKLSANIDVAAATLVNLKNQVKSIARRAHRVGHAAFVQAKADSEIRLARCSPSDCDLETVSATACKARTSRKGNRCWNKYYRHSGSG